MALDFLGVVFTVKEQVSLKFLCDYWPNKAKVKEMRILWPWDHG